MNRLRDWLHFSFCFRCRTRAWDEYVIETTARMLAERGKG
jgi:hypothetical protein